MQIILVFLLAKYSFLTEQLIGFMLIANFFLYSVTCLNAYCNKMEKNSQPQEENVFLGLNLCQGLLAIILTLLHSSEDA